ncbi:flagellar hook-associated protein FlgK [Pseudodesulfovibrio cashew]|uniref:Flagellar hook-associated protein 1 n=1 Tax=Pseudodesulfovibrio cashew TaxID=2678688 RepID=A0A6I6JPJ8_9BACT|nr:flagellar hook-associated protein FlgK [Pseudodesulfovibrio cashew]QGY39554.1 flagellar hook-associated protein FlgK [Pseudodesulfovibrio cashew]
MLNNLYNIATTALQNAQVSVDNASNNIANADTEGYQRTTVVYETSESITIYGLTVGTGADVAAIQSEKDDFVEAQYLEASADAARETAALEYLSQLDTLLDQEEDSGLNYILGEFLDGWNELTTDPDSSSAREALLGEAETLVYALNSTAEELETMADTIDSEIKSQISDANQLIEDIAAANAAITANPDDTQAISDRDQMIRDLDEIIGVEVIEQSSGAVTILTEEGYTLVDGTSTHSLVYGTAQVTSTLIRDSDYEGTLEYSGSSSEEILIEFVSSGADGTAQFKVSTDGGNTWQTDENGDTLLYTAGDEDSSVTIEGVEIWFDGTGDHAEGDRYTVIAKSGLYWENGDGNLQNITPMTDDSGSDVSGRTSSGSLAGLFIARDDTVIPTLDDLDDLAEALIWEVNEAHSEGVGLEGQTSLTASFSVDDASDVLSNSGLAYADRIEAGDIALYTYDSDGEVSTSAIISVDPATSTLDSVAADINTAFGGELTATVTDGQLTLSSASDMTFEIGEDTSNLLAALGINTFFTGSDAASIALDATVATDTSHINAGTVNSDGSVSSGSNTVAETIATLADETVTVGDTETSLTEALSALVTEVGSAAASTELKQTYAQTSADYYYDQQASASEVNIDEELIALTKYQQAYQAAAEIITVTREMMDTILDIV